MEIDVIDAIINNVIPIVIGVSNNIEDITNDKVNNNIYK
jgi:hypothetical protein